MGADTSKLQIMLFPSRELYDSKLTAHESVSSRLLADLMDSEGNSLGEKHEDDGLLSEPVIFYDTAGSAMYERAEDSAADDASVRRTVDGESKSNENEAELVMQFIAELLEAGVQKSSIAVISPYNAQVALMQGLIREKYPSDPLLMAGASGGEAAHASAIEVGSVDGFQGREKNVIILTLVRSNDKKEVGFLSEKRRLNGAYCCSSAICDGVAKRLTSNAACSRNDTRQALSLCHRGQRDGARGRQVSQGLDGLARGKCGRQGRPVAFQYRKASGSCRTALRCLRTATTTAKPMLVALRSSSLSDPLSEPRHTIAGSPR